jgi:hypothetical protein
VDVFRIVKKTIQNCKNLPAKAIWAIVISKEIDYLCTIIQKFMFNKKAL